MSADVLSPFAGRLVPARPDLAAEDLRGRVEAERFACGQPRQVTADLLDLTLTPDTGTGIATQLLHGEGFTVYESRADGLCWGQSALDGYVGYVATDGLGPPEAGEEMIVTALASHVYAEPRLKARSSRELPFRARLRVAGREGGYTRLASGEFVPTTHLEPARGDFVAQAERLIGAPYLWGGRSPRGLDCSSLVQLALDAVGFPAPRDSDMQAATIGQALVEDAALQRGDLIFWKGHIGILTDPATLLHANAYHMAVAVEPLAAAVKRIAAGGDGPVTFRRRIEPLPGA